MDVSLFQAAAGMNASSRWQEVIADNLAASQVPGFKSQDMSFSAVQSGFMGRPPGAVAMPSQRFVMPLAGASTNFQPGELHPTGVSTDLAVEGAGFFAVRTPEGTPAYTRDGEFHLSVQGQLATKQGLPVLGDNDLAIELDPQSVAPIVVAPTGEITQGGAAKGRVKVAEFKDTSVLTSTGTGYFVSNDPLIQPSASTTARVRQGFLENGNSSTLLEMGNLITALRYYEANQKVIQTEDERVNQLISSVSQV
jgi:flagellar basal body rod protein FlgG